MMQAPVTDPIRSDKFAPLVGIAHAVVLAHGARRALIAFTAGAAGALALPPVGFVPAIAATMTVAVWLVDGGGGGGGGGGFLSRAKQAAIAGWFLGFGYFVAGLYWLGAAFLVEPDRFAWLLPLGVLGLPAVLAVFPAMGLALASLLWRADGARILVLAFALGVSEIARGTLFTGFPWNVYGMAFGQFPVLAQSASIFGLYGLTAIVIALAAALATLGDPDRASHAVWRSPVVLSAIAAVFLVVFGAARLQGAKVEFLSSVRLRIMQPNLPQDAKFKPSAGNDILRRYLELSDRPTSPTTAGLANVTHLIWPESAFPFVLGREPSALSMIGSALAGRAILLTGAIRLESDKTSQTRAYNSLQALDGGGQIIASADKTHLVPFGEYLPASGLLRALGLRQFIALPGGFDPGVERRVMNVPGLPPFQPLICYEAIFPGDVTSKRVEGGRPRPEFFLNVTNDGWFGITSGPYQHLAQARLRTIEEGLPLVRAANTGISTIVDPYGRATQELPLGVAGVLDGQLPKRIEPPIFARYPWTSVLVVYGLLLAGSLMRRPGMKVGPTRPAQADRDWK